MESHKIHVPNHQPEYHFHVKTTVSQFYVPIVSHFPHLEDGILSGNLT